MKTVHELNHMRNVRTHCFDGNDRKRSYKSNAVMTVVVKTTHVIRMVMNGKTLSSHSTHYNI